VSNVVYVILWLLVNAVGRLFFRYRVVGRERVPKQGGVLIAANHASYVDIPFMGAAVRRRMWFLGRQDLFLPGLRPVVQWLGWIPIRQDRLDREGFEKAVRLIQDGKIVVIYPEGTRTPDGALRRGKPGIGVIVWYLVVAALGWIAWLGNYTASPGSEVASTALGILLIAALWAGIWDPKAQSFSFYQVDDFGAREQGMPLEMLYNAKGDRLYVTTAKPGFVNLYDNTDPRQPKFLQAIPAAPGAHHSVLSPDERYLFVQNSLLNLESMSDGSITVIDLTKGKVLGSIETLKAQGFNPNCIMLLPNHFQQADLRANQVVE